MRNRKLPPRQHIHRPSIEHKRQNEPNVVSNRQGRKKGEEPHGEKLQRIRPKLNRSEALRIAQQGMMKDIIAALEGSLVPPYMARHFIYIARLSAKKARRQLAMYWRRHIKRDQQITKNHQPSLVRLTPQQSGFSLGSWPPRGDAASAAASTTGRFFGGDMRAEFSSLCMSLYFALSADSRIRETPARYMR